MIVRVAVAVLGAVALLVSMLGLSCVASEQWLTPASPPIAETKGPMADVLRSAPPIESEIDGGSASELRPTLTF